MVGGHKRFTGNILWYDYLSSKRAPVFLDRNLTRALRLHQHLAENGSTENFTDDDRDIRSIWTPPEQHPLDNMVEQLKSKGAFVLKIHSISLMESNSVPPEDRSRRHAKKGRLVFRARSNIQVHIFGEQEDAPCFSHPSQIATLEGVDKDGKKVIHVDIEPITIKPDSIAQDFRTRGLRKVYRLYVSINLETQRDAEDMHEHLSADQKVTRTPSTHLSVKWADIMKCPEGPGTLPMRDSKNGAHLGLDVSMYWNTLGGRSILAAHNESLRATSLPTTYRTPPAAADQPAFDIAFVYANETISKSGLICPHCKSRKAADIDDFRMHLDTWHDYFKYTAKKEAVEDGVERWRFDCEQFDHTGGQRASAKADEPFDVRVVAPEEPFDRRRYLNKGNDDYQRTARLEKRQTASKAGTTAPTRIPAPPKRKPPEQVQEIPLREKTTYTVPAAPPGITFFRARTRRPLKTGESISESDDELDETWITRRKSAEYNVDTQLTDDVKAFLKIFDKFMRREQLRSDLHVGDALIRFVRENATWILQTNVFTVFQKKIDELLVGNIISAAFHAGALKIVNEADKSTSLSQHLAALDVRPPQASAASSRARGVAKQDKGKGKAKVSETGHLTPITADSDGDVEMRESTPRHDPGRATPDKEDETKLPFDRCLCGGDAQASDRKSPMIACSGMVSPVSHISNVHTDRLTGLHTQAISLRVPREAMGHNPRLPRSQETSLDLQRLQVSIKRLSNIIYEPDQCSTKHPL
jgi:hypothetical protein